MTLPRAPARRRPKTRVLRLTAAYVRTRDGWYAAEILDARAVLTQGKTIEEARENLLDVVQAMLELAPHQFNVKTRAAPPGALTETLLVVLPA